MEGKEEDDVDLTDLYNSPSRYHRAHHHLQLNRISKLQGKIFQGPTFPKIGLPIHCQFLLP